MRVALLLMVAGCGFKGANLGDIDASAGIDAVLSTADAPADGDEPTIDSPSTTTPDAAIDAQLADAMMPPPMCPAGGTTVGTNVFYYSTDLKHWWEAETACEAMKLTAGGAKPVHLAVPSGVAELATCGALVGLDAWAWIGYFQSETPKDHGKDQDWLSIAGGAGTMNWHFGEPSDGSFSPENGVENFAQLYTDGTMNDTKGTDNTHYICECDGKGVDPGNAAKVPDEPTN